MAKEEPLAHERYTQSVSTKYICPFDKVLSERYCNVEKLYKSLVEGSGHHPKLLPVSLYSESRNDVQDQATMFWVDPKLLEVSGGDSRNKYFNISSLIIFRTRILSNKAGSSCSCGMNSRRR